MSYDPSLTPVQRRIADELDLPDEIRNARHPLASDTTPFGIWLRCQIHRTDRVGALARVAAQDPHWPGGVSRQKVRAYFVQMGARAFVLGSVKDAWNEFEKHQRKTRTAKRRQSEKAARKTQQKVNRQRRGKRR